MLLSDVTIRECLKQGRIVVDPQELDNIQPASVDLRLADRIMVFKNSDVRYIDPRQEIPDMMEPVAIKGEAGFVLHPNEFALGSTLERVELADDIAGKIEGKSSLGRIGLLIHSTAGFVDPGWRGQLTLELANVSRLPIVLHSGMRICQISFHQMSTSVERPYGSKELRSRYQDQQGPTASRIHHDFTP